MTPKEQKYIPGGYIKKYTTMYKYIYMHRMAVKYKKEKSKGVKYNGIHYIHYKKRRMGNEESYIIGTSSNANKKGIPERERREKN